MKTEIKDMTILRTQLWELRNNCDNTLCHVFKTLREAEEYCIEEGLTYNVRK